MNDFEELYLERLLELQDVLGAASEVCDRARLAVQAGKLDVGSDFDDAVNSVLNAIDSATEATLEAEDNR